MDESLNRFNWENIGINTYVAKLPGGWLLKSVDTKNGIAGPDSDDAPPESLKRVPIAMSNSMVFIPDPMHGWSFAKFRWVNISHDTWSAMVSGGWIIKCVDTKDLTYFDNLTLDQIKISSSMIFFPDNTHTWRPEKPVSERSEEEEDRNEEQ